MCKEADMRVRQIHVTLEYFERQVSTMSNLDHTTKISSLTDRTKEPARQL